MSSDEVVRVEIWSDIVCPWCYIGKRRFERAVAELDGELVVDIVYRPFELDPTASPGSSIPASCAIAVTRSMTAFACSGPPNLRA